MTMSLAMSVVEVHANQGYRLISDAGKRGMQAGQCAPAQTSETPTLWQKSFSKYFVRFCLWRTFMDE